MRTLDELRAEARAALDAWTTALAAEQALADDCSNDDRAAARAATEAAEARQRAAAEAFTRAQSLENARRDLPPIPDTDSDDDRRNAGGGGSDAGVVREPLTYERGNGQSYLLDLARELTGRGIAGAAARLSNHAQDTRRIVADRERRAREGVGREIEQALRELHNAGAGAVVRALEASGMLGAQRDTRALTRVDGAGGNFVPPIWLMEEYAAVPRAARPMVESMRHIPLPAGTDSINVPKISTGTLTAVQTSDGAAIASTDLTDAVVNAPVRTIAGQQDIALQLLDQSPIAFDEIVFADLTADYYFRCEDQAFNGSGAAGQIKGMLNASGLLTVTYTDATPTVPKLYPKLADAIYNQARTNRKLPITHGWVAPRRYGWVMAALDSQNRPLVTPQVNMPMNAVGVQTGDTGGGSGQDHPLNLQGVNHWPSDAVPVNLGGGANEDRIIETRMQDHLWFEGDLHARAMQEVLSGTLQVRLQVYAYVAATFERFPQGIAVIAGTGLIPPTF